MATPIVHATAGVIIASGYLLLPRIGFKVNFYPYLMFAIVLACIPDIDLLYSFLLTGSVSTLHFGITHSVFFACSLGLIAWILGKQANNSYGLLVFFLVLSHVVIDGFTGPVKGFNSTVGLQPWLPFNDVVLVSPVTLFQGVEHKHWLSITNVRTLIKDMLYVPFAALFVCWVRLRMK